jgi:hypothetical protein
MRQRTLAFRRAALAAMLVGLLGCASPVGRTPDADRRAPAALPAESGVEPAKEATGDAPVVRWALSERDKTLKSAIERWAREAGWRLVWELGVDYRISAAASIEGTFETAVTEVVKNMEHADVPPKAIFYRGNQVLRVVARGME